MSEQSALRVLFALTPGAVLADWHRAGTLRRELQPYLYYLRCGWQVTVLQCARRSPPALEDRLGVYSIPHWRLAAFWDLLPPWYLRNYDVIKTNQSLRADLFVKPALRWRKPVVLRCGYVAGERQESELGLTPAVKAYQKLEGWAFRNATLAQVTTPDLKDWVVERYQAPAEKVRVVPNFVDVEVFSPGSSGAPQGEFSVVTVGRLNSVKRMHLMIEACHLAGNTALKIAGDGPLKGELERQAAELTVPVEFAGQIQNELLPGFLQSGSVFLITSLREGHPKSLIEAMACGMPCVGVRVPGIQNIITDGENGLLVDAEPAAIAGALAWLKNDAGLRSRLGTNARRYALAHYEKSVVLEMDKRVVEEAVTTNRKR